MSLPNLSLPGFLHALPTGWKLFLCLACLSLPVQAFAQAPATSTLYGIDVKIIEATRTPGEKKNVALDPALESLANDLRALPFDGFKLLDTMRKELGAGEAFTLQFGRPNRKRFLQVKAEAQQQPGKVKVAVAMQQDKGKKPKVEFRSEVSIPEGGTLVLVATRKGMPPGSVLLLAISADKPRTAPVGQEVLPLASSTASSSPPAGPR